MDETSLIQRLTEGEEDAWSEFMAQYSGLVRSAVRKTLSRHAYGASHEDVEDIQGEFLLSLVADGARKLTLYEGRNGASLSSYIWTLASRAAIDHLRARNLAPRTEINDIAFDNVRDAMPAPDMAIEARQAEGEVVAALSSLSARDRLFVKLYYEMERPTDDVAKFFKVTPSTVYSMKSRVIDRMRKFYCKKNPVSPS